MAREIKPGSVAAVVALANCFVAQKAAPGWHALTSLGDELKRQAREAVLQYRGTDKEELFDLTRRAQVAEALMNEFFGLVEQAINEAKGLPGFQHESGQAPAITERIAGSY